MKKQKEVVAAPAAPAAPAVITPTGKKRGRKPKTRATRIRELTRAGFTPKMVAAKTGSPIGYVYTIRAQMKNEMREVHEMPVPPTPKQWVELPVVVPRPSLWDRIKSVFSA